jgi:UDP-glucuronate 4-epimerase
MDMKILVTGGAGFIGSHVMERLAVVGHEVCSVDNFNDYYDPAIKRKNIAAIKRQFPVVSYEMDIREKERLRQVFRENHFDAVIHLAAMAGVRPSIQNPAYYYDVNITGTVNLLDLIKEAQIKHFIFASSSSVYGNNKKVPFSEKDFVDHPISPYAATKKSGELLCHTYHHLYDINTVCLRFFTVYGPRQRPDLAIHKFMKKIINNETIPVYGDGSSKRDYTYIDDIVTGIVKSLDFMCENDGCFEVFNLGESRTISLSEMIETIERVTGKQAKIERLPMQPGDVKITYADITKARKMLEYEPSMDFEEGIRRFYEWMKS